MPRTLAENSPNGNSNQQRREPGTFYTMAKAFNQAVAKLPRSAIVVYEMLSEQQNNGSRVAIFPGGQQKLAARTKLSMRQVKRALGMLEEHGLIAIERGDGRGHESRYTLLDNALPDAPKKGDIKGDIKGDKRRTNVTLYSLGKGDTRVQKRVTPVSPQQLDSKNTRLSESLRPSSARDSRLKDLGGTHSAAATTAAQEAAPSRAPLSDPRHRWTVDRYRLCYDFDRYLGEQVEDGKTVEEVCARFPSLAVAWAAWKNQRAAGTLVCPGWCADCLGDRGHIREDSPGHRVFVPCRSCTRSQSRNGSAHFAGGPETIH